MICIAYKCVETVAVEICITTFYLKFTTAVLVEEEVEVLEDREVGLLLSAYYFTILPKMEKDSDELEHRKGRFSLERREREPNELKQMKG